jgi:hypothetical protein
MKKLKNFDAEKTKKFIHKVVSAARAGLEIYIAVKRKDPIYVGTALLSTYSALENMLHKEDPDIYKKLVDMGLKPILNDMEKLVYFSLMEMGVPYHTWYNSKTSNNERSILEFNLEGYKGYFVINSGMIRGLYAEDEDEFIGVFSKLIEKHMGPNITVTVGVEGWSTFIRIMEIEIPLSTYMSTIDIDEHYDTIMKFREKKLNRSSLLFGPPGCGKTTYAAKMASMMGGRLVVLDAPALNFMSEYGLPINKIFRALSPTVVLFDDIDRLASRGLDMMLGTIEAINRYKGSGEIVIMGSVNCLSALPPAMRRPGRFDEIVVFDKPSDDQRRVIIRAYMEELGTRLSDANVDVMVAETEGMTPAYIKEVVQQADVKSFEKIPAIIAHMKRMMGGDEEEDGRAVPEGGNGVNDAPCYEAKVVEVTDECSK